MENQHTEKIAVLEAQMDNIQKNIAEIRSDVKEIKNSLLPVSDHEKRISILEKRENLAKWLNPTISAILSSVMTYLVIHYINNL